MKPYNAKSRWMCYAKGESTHSPKRCGTCSPLHGKGKIGGGFFPDGGLKKINFGGRQNIEAAALKAASY
jgi:hypothetical protein